MTHTSIIPEQIIIKISLITETLFLKIGRKNKYLKIDMRFFIHYILSYILFIHYIFYKLTI